jgi:D-methionine transport system substrate-binding protein
MPRTSDALKLLDANDVIVLDDSIDPYAATLDDIAENPKNVEFLEVPIPSLNAAYEEADLVYQWPSHIKALGLNPADDGLITELDDRFALYVAVREDDAKSAATAALKRAFASEQVREVIESNGTIDVAF